MRRQIHSKPLIEADGPFRYTYIAITELPGIKFPESVESDAVVEKFPELSGTTFLSATAESHFTQFDRSAAVGLLLLTGLVGTQPDTWTSMLADRLYTVRHGGEAAFERRVSRESDRVRLRRIKDQGVTGCYCVYRAEGPLIEPLSFDNARTFGKIGVGIDLMNREPYKLLHRKAVHSSSTALGLAISGMKGSPETRFVGDIVYLIGPDGLTVYPKTLTGGAVGVAVAVGSIDETISSARTYLPALFRDDRIESAVSLFVQSQGKANDNLRAFIAAWSGLELLINRLERIHRPRWVQMLAQQEATLPAWDRQLAGVEPGDYRLRDRFFAVACVLNSESAAQDSALFIQMNDKRSGYYHRLDVDDKDLPAAEAQAMFRRYLKFEIGVKA